MAAGGIVAENPVWMAVGRGYFAVQSLAGALWWFAVFTVDAVREATLGGADPRLVAMLDVPLFVVASLLAALGIRWAPRIAVPWTLLVAFALVIGATATGRAGWGAFAMVAASAGSLAAWLLMERGGSPPSSPWSDRCPSGSHGRRAPRGSSSARSLSSRSSGCSSSSCSRC
ncbi:hypothetical protein [Leucobacter soli]|uniref:hypothetical protein n=1 Tax=Leucobacter soli TaxID=2812850 RepID=UPI003613D0DB